MVNGPSFGFCAQQSNGADANQGHERNEDVRNQHAATGEDEGRGSAVAFLNQDGRGVGLNGVEDEQDTGESHPHHHAALEEGAVKELPITPLLPSAHACPSVKIPRLTVCLNLRWGQWFSG